jgi:hypothetical protein
MSETAPDFGPGFLSRHAALFTAPGIDPEAVAARQYHSVISKAKLKSLGFSENQRCVPALLIPIRNRRWPSTTT